MVSVRLLQPIHELQKRRALQAERRAADEELIASVLPSPRLAWRVQELVAAEYRLGISRGITDVVHDADSGRLPGASPLNRVAVRSARPQLLALASRLADLDVHVLPRGVLLADRLVTDSRSPLYDRARAELAGREVERALTALERRSTA